MIKTVGLILVLLVLGFLIVPNFVKAINPDSSPKKSDTVAYYTSFDPDRDNNHSFKNIGGSDGEVVPVISLNQLPVGNYLVTVTAQIGGTFGCSLDPIAFIPNPPISYWTPDLNTLSIQFVEAIRITEQRDLILYCRSNPGEDMQELKVGFVASKVDILNITP